MKFSTITLALVSGMASIASAERPKSNARIVNPMINDSAKPVSTVKEQGQRHLTGKSTSSTKSGKSKSGKSGGPCDMLGMGCTITVAAGANLAPGTPSPNQPANECNAIAGVRAEIPVNTGEFTCSAAPNRFGNGGSFAFNANFGRADGANSCLRFSNCGTQAANEQAITIPPGALEDLIEQCEACQEVEPIRLQCTDDFLFRYTLTSVAPEVGSPVIPEVPGTLCAGVNPNEADVDSFNCATGTFVARSTGFPNRCFRNTPGGPDNISTFIERQNRQEIINACLQCPNAVGGVAPGGQTRAQPISQVQQASSITGSELRLSTPVAATETATTNGGGAISGVTGLSASMIALAAFGMFIF